MKEPVPRGKKVADIVPGGGDTCVILPDASVECWGNSYIDELPLDQVSVKIPLPGPATQVAVGHDHACAIDNWQRLWCWGRNAYGAVGSGEQLEVDAKPWIPTHIDLDERVRSVSAGAGTCVVTQSRKARCWGPPFVLGTGREQPLGDDEPALDGDPIPFDEPVESVAVGWYNACAILASGRVACWGRGAYGELGRDLGDAEEDLTASSDEAFYVWPPSD